MSDPAPGTPVAAGTHAGLLEPQAHRGFHSLPRSRDGPYDPSRGSCWTDSGAWLPASVNARKKRASASSDVQHVPPTLMISSRTTAPLRARTPRLAQRHTVDG